MGSKHRLTNWLHSIFAEVEFSSAADPFCGGGSVSYLLKAMGKSVYASDFLNFPTVISSAVVANSDCVLDFEDAAFLTSCGSPRMKFISETFKQIFFTAEDLEFLDLAWERLPELASPSKRDIALAAMIRSCMKKQPRGVFTVGSTQVGGGLRYDDGRRDVHLSLRDHFREQVSVLNGLVFDNGRVSTAERRSALDPPNQTADLVYFDPPYVPRKDDNCYVKRYHFLEGLSTYWREGEIMESSKVKKLAKRHTPFSHRRTALEAFDQLFRNYADSIIALSYSSNGYPDRELLERLLKVYKPRVEVFERPHRYHFGTHSAVERALTTEYVLLGLND
jgi:DNA adenine methylase/adenine-specific DNA-methyltransferase